MGKQSGKLSSGISGSFRRNTHYEEKLNLYERLRNEIASLEESIELESYGLYKPHYNFDTSEQYKEKLNETYERQKDLIKSKQAAVCDTEWSVSGSKAEGRRMTSRNIKLILRAFNNECDASILKVRWNNVTNMEERIKKAFVDLNKLGETNQICITNEYLQKKLDELHLVYEYQEKLHEEKEEQRRIRQEMIEEERVQREIENAQIEAEKEEKRYSKALEQARKDLEKAHGEKFTQLNEQINSLEIKLKEAQELKARAISMAQLTKSGRVYVISNIGSFGDRVYKIGMTRRLDPNDRIRELGDASVPFSFDIHAMIYSKDAPSLENNIQRELQSRKVNLVNDRKEFFYASLDEIEKIVKKYNSEIQFTRIAEAKEYRESLALREKSRKSYHEETKKFVNLKKGALNVNNE